MQIKRRKEMFIIYKSIDLPVRKTILLKETYEKRELMMGKKHTTKDELPKYYQKVNYV
jgi:hypothetical protein